MPPRLQVASALAFLHARNIIMIDLKPGNVMLTAADGLAVKLSDYGFSAARERNIALGRRASNFTAPEMRQVPPLPAAMASVATQTAPPQATGLNSHPAGTPGPVSHAAIIMHVSCNLLHQTDSHIDQHTSTCQCQASIACTMQAGLPPVESAHT